MENTDSIKALCVDKVQNNSYIRVLISYILKQIDNAAHQYIDKASPPPPPQLQ